MTDLASKLLEGLKTRMNSFSWLHQIVGRLDYDLHMLLQPKWARSFAAVTACVVPLILFTPVLAAPAGACPAEFSPLALGQGSYDLEFTSVSNLSHSMTSFSNGALAVTSKTNALVLDNAGQQLIAIEMPNPSVTLQPDFYRIRSRTTDEQRMFTLDGVERSDLSPSIAVRSTDGAYVWSFQNSGDERRVVVYDSDGEPDVRYGTAGVVLVSDLTLPGDTIEGSTIIIAGARFEGATLVLFLIKDPHNWNVDAKAYRATIPADGTVATSAPVNLGSGLDWTYPSILDIEASEPAALLPMTNSSDDIDALIITWSGPDLTTVNEVETGTGGSNVRSAIGGEHWWLQGSAGSPQRHYVAIKPDGSVSSAVVLPGNTTSETIWPDFSTGQLRVIHGLRVEHYKSNTNPATYLHGGLSDQVSRLYRAGLGREAEPEGLRYWKELRARGMSLTDMASAFIGTQEFQSNFAGLNDRDFVQRLYQFVLGRGGEDDGVAFWTNEIQLGHRTRRDVLVEFSESAENIIGTRTLPADQRGAAIFRLYRAYFLRDPDPAGHCFHADQLRNCGRGYDCLNLSSEQFASSPEFQQRYGSLADEEFVHLIYVNVLGRAADPAGLVHWQTQLRSGFSRGQVMVLFSESEEFRLLTDSVPYPIDRSAP